MRLFVNFFVMLSLLTVVAFPRKAQAQWVNPNSSNYPYQAHIASYWEGNTNICRMFSYSSAVGNFIATRDDCTRFCHIQQADGIVCACYPVRDGNTYPRFCAVRE